MTTSQSTRCVPLTGDAARRATLEAKIGIATSRLNWDGLPKKQRAAEAENLARFQAELSNLA